MACATAARLQISVPLVEYENVDSSRALPTGVVTFLLTDIEGSTRRWEYEPEAMRDALARHDAIVTAYVKRLNGYVVKSKGEGDSAFAVFSHARDAVAAAILLQCVLGGQSWPTVTSIRVRMAIHTGQVELRDGDYYGPTVNRCARLRSLAQGGQVLISGVTAQLTRGQLPKDAHLLDLGTHQLKDLSAPERVWQLTHPKMPWGSAEATPAKPAESPVEPTVERELRAYLLTDHNNRSVDGQQWAERITHTSTGLSREFEHGTIRCYASVNAAALLNGQHERFRLARAWEVIVDADTESAGGVLECREVTTLRQVGLPGLTGQHHAIFAVLCARTACRGQNAAAFGDWAASWLAGEDASGINARELADALERQARPDPDSGLTLPHELMLANAARSAAHAAKLSWLPGRARDEENARAIECASRAVHTALRMARLDPVALADQAVPKLTAVPPMRPRTPVTPVRILRALPT